MDLVNNVLAATLIGLMFVVAPLGALVTIVLDYLEEQEARTARQTRMVNTARESSRAAFKAFADSYSEDAREAELKRIFRSAAASRETIHSYLTKGAR